MGEERQTFKTRKDEIRDLLERCRPHIKPVLPLFLQLDRFEQLFLNVFVQNEALQESTNRSIANAYLQAATLGLETTGQGQAYVTAYKRKIKGQNGQPDIYVKDAQLVVGYKGIMELARRSGELISITAEAVHEKDHFLYMYGKHENLEHIPAAGDRGEIISYYAYMHLKNGGFKFLVRSKKEIEAHAKKHSQTDRQGNLTGNWTRNFDSMAKKSVITELFKYFPLSVMNQVKETIQEEPADVDLETGEILNQ